MRTAAYADLTGIQRQLIEAAELAILTAYNPYSRFAVGAALLAAEGEIIAASNYENAAYGSTLCAERAALVRANALGRRDLRALAVLGRGADPEADDGPVSGPCGACRQMLFEASQVAGVELEIILPRPRSQTAVLTTIGELLPLPFGPRDLGVNLVPYAPRA